MISIGGQNYLFASAAASLTSKLRSLSFRAILRQDSMLFPGFHVVSCSISFFQSNTLIETRTVCVTVALVDASE